MEPQHTPKFITVSLRRTFYLVDTAQVEENGRLAAYITGTSATDIKPFAEFTIRNWHKLNPQQKRMILIKHIRAAEGLIVAQIFHEKHPSKLLMNIETAKNVPMFQNMQDKRRQERPEPLKTAPGRRSKRR